MGTSSRPRSKGGTPAPEVPTLADLRRLHDLTQVEVAVAAGMDQSELTKAERRTGHRVATLRRCVEALGAGWKCSPDSARSGFASRGVRMATVFKRDDSWGEVEVRGGSVGAAANQLRHEARSPGADARTGGDAIPRRKVSKPRPVLSQGRGGGAGACPGASRVAVPVRLHAVALAQAARHPRPRPAATPRQRCCSRRGCRWRSWSASSGTPRPPSRQVSMGTLMWRTCARVWRCPSSIRPRSLL